MMSGHHQQKRFSVETDPNFSASSSSTTDNLPSTRVETGQPDSPLAFPEIDKIVSSFASVDDDDNDNADEADETPWDETTFEFIDKEAEDPTEESTEYFEQQEEDGEPRYSESVVESSTTDVLAATTEAEQEPCEPETPREIEAEVDEQEEWEAAAEAAGDIGEEQASLATATPAAGTTHLLILITKMGLNRNQVQNQQRAMQCFEALGFPYETLDGADPANKEIRNELFRISGMRGVYPLFFLVKENYDDDGEDPVQFLGDWDTVEGINDSSSLPQEILDANPTCLTWDKIPGLVSTRTRMK